MVVTSPDCLSVKEIADRAMRHADRAMRLAEDNRLSLKDIEMGGVVWRTNADARHLLLESKVDNIHSDVVKLNSTADDFRIVSKLINSGWKVAAWILALPTGAAAFFKYLGV